MTTETTTDEKEKMSKSAVFRHEGDEEDEQIDSPDEPSVMSVVPERKVSLHRIMIEDEDEDSEV